MSNDLRRGRHVVYNLHVHLVFVAKYRRKVFTKEILDDMQVIFEEVCSKFEAQLVEFDGECDHVHLLVVYPPKVAISSLVNSLKDVSSRLLRKKNIRLLKGSYGAMRYGRLAILQVVVAVLQWRLFASISNSKIHRTKYHLDVSMVTELPYIHRLKSVVLRQRMIN